MRYIVILIRESVNLVPVLILFYLGKFRYGYLRTVLSGLKLAKAKFARSNYVSSGRDETEWQIARLCVSKMGCLFDLGKPRPRVTWFLESQTIDAPTEIRESQGPAGETNVVTISNVTLKGLTRSHYHAKLFCKANNTHLAPPPTTAVIIELHSELLLLLTRV